MVTKQAFKPSPGQFTNEETNEMAFFFYSKKRHSGNMNLKELVNVAQNMIFGHEKRKKEAIVF